MFRAIWHRSNWADRAMALVLASAFGLFVATWASMSDLSALDLRSKAHGQILLDREGHPLSEERSRWNVQDQVPLYEIPQGLQDAVLTAEDQRFYQHGGVDWLARFHALWQDLRAGHNVRGASTISEQVVRMLVPRPRTLWSKWVEGFDAKRLEDHATKADILEFYLNQVPYASNRRGVVAAARFYFDRDLDTLDGREMLALAILPRAPSGLDPYHGGKRRLDKRTIHLATQMRHDGLLSGDHWERIVETPLVLARPVREFSIGHFRSFVEQQASADTSHLKPEKLRTTLDSGLMSFVQGLVDQRVKALAGREVHNAAALVVDRRSGDILAWVVAGAKAEDNDTPGRFLDAVLVPRQPGSALKPFLYAASFDAGWSPGSSILDAPLSEAVGTGIHQFNNYSHQFYGDVSIRQALGNSLNIPAVRMVNMIGPDHYLSVLHKLGFKSLTRGAGFYGDGLALGNGEVSLLELVRAYAALANEGRTVSLHAIENNPDKDDLGMQVFSPDAATMVSDVLSDPWARSMEFGRYSTLDLPIQTAVKTGTSSDYRDAWSVGYDSRYVVGIWMGNLDQSPMDGVTGSTGPGLVLRGIFAYLNRDQNTSKLALSSELFLQENCVKTSVSCKPVYDYRSPVTKEQSSAEDSTYPAIVSPSENLRLAFDPRLPVDKQSFRFAVSGVGKGDKVTWYVDGDKAATTKGGDYDWPVARGYYSMKAKVETEEGKKFILGPVDYSVR